MCPVRPRSIDVTSFHPPLPAASRRKEFGRSGLFSVAPQLHWRLRPNAVTTTCPAGTERTQGGDEMPLAVAQKELAMPSAGTALPACLLW